MLFKAAPVRDYPQFRPEDAFAAVATGARGIASAHVMRSGIVTSTETRIRLLPSPSAVGSIRFVKLAAL